MSLPSLELLFDSNKSLLEDIRLAALNRAANLSKQLKKGIDEWIEQECAAQIAEWMIDHRDALMARRQVDVQPLKAEWIDREGKKTA